MSGIELRHFRCFLVLSEELNFTAAARRLFITQQTLSRTIAQLEHLVGEDLFVRNTRVVQLTKAGTAMIPAARKAVGAADDAVHAVRGHADDRRLRVDISSGGLETGALIIRAMRTHHPDIGVHQVELGVRRGVEALLTGRLDLVLGLANERTDVAVELIRQEPVLVGMSEHHPLAGQSEIPVAALQDHPLLLPDPDAAQEWIDFVTGFCHRAGVEPRRWQHITHGSIAAAEALREGVCVTPTNSWIDPPADLVFLPLIDPVPVYDWSMIWSPNGPSEDTVSLLRRSARDLSRRHHWIPDQRRASQQHSSP